MNIIDLIFPPTCGVCGKSFAKAGKHELMCADCQANMPRIHSHMEPFNELHQKLAAVSVPIVRAAAMYRYSNVSDYAALVRDAKYHRQPWLIRSLAHNYAAEIAPDGFFDGIDAIVPIPMHWFKELRRGFNQSYELARGLSDITRLPIVDNLEATRSHKTQTHLSGDERRKNLAGIFKVYRADELKGKHLLLVDDIITTGTTLLEAGKTLIDSVTEVRLSVLALASTSYA